MLRLLSIVACKKELYSRVEKVIGDYSSRVYYVGEIPRATVIKLALNNIGLSIPALLAESLMLLESWSVELELFYEISRNTWFGKVIERYWSRVMEEKKPGLRHGWLVKTTSI